MVACTGLVRMLTKDLILDASEGEPVAYADGQDVCVREKGVR